MKRGIIGILVILLVAGLSAPLVNGMLAERMIRNSSGSISKMYADMGLDLKAEVTRYDRGYQASEMEWQVDFGKMAPLYGGLKAFTVKVHLKHGFTGVVAKTDLMANPGYAAFINSKLGGKDPLHITTLYSLGGRINTEIQLDAFSLTAQNEALKVEPARFTASTDDQLRHVVSEGHWDGCSIDGKMTLAGLSLQSDLTMVSPYLWAGTMNMAVQNMRIDDPKAKEPVAFNNLTARSQADYDQARKAFSGMVEYGLDSMTIGDKTIDQGRIRLVVKNLNGPGTEELMRQYMAAISEITVENAKAGGDEEQQKERMKKQMTRLGMQLAASAEKLLTKDLEFQITDLHVRLPEGEINGSFKVGLTRDMTFTQFMPLVSQPALALDIFSLNSSLSMPKKLTGGAAKLYDPLFPGMQSGIFMDKGQMIEHHAEIKDRKLLLNGKEVIL